MRAAFGSDYVCYCGVEDSVGVAYEVWDGGAWVYCLVVVVRGVASG